ncbi:MAG: DinB family protein [Chloroflexi bacterium]|nr:DinB family protein [Chloroflexota bacterium]
MNERDHIIAEFEKSRGQMRAIVARADSHQAIYPRWTMKEVLDHLSGWDDAVISILNAHISGVIEDMPSVRGIDAYNAETVSTREALSYEHSLREWEASREAVKKLILKVPDEKMNEVFPFPWGGSGNVADMLRIFYEHEEEHAEEIHNIIEKGK